MRARTPLSMPEFIALMAVLFATIAFSIDAMLPALPEIAQSLAPEAPNRAQLVLSAFVLGMGGGTFFAGPISDAVGRKPAITGLAALYILGALISWRAQTLDGLLFGRLIQGIGASGPRVVSLALVRDSYSGARMAQITSFVMMVFIIVPSMAPLIGSVIIDAFGWRAIFIAFVLFGLFGAGWLNLRQPETLPPENRRPLSARNLGQAIREVLTNRLVVMYIIVMTLGFGQMFALLSSIQQIFEEIFDLADQFPMWFMATGLVAGIGTVINASLVMRLGMRRIAMASYAMQICVSAVVLLLVETGVLHDGLAFPVTWIWMTSVMFMAGLTFGNLNALALEPLGHIAGLAASVIGGLSSVGAVLIAGPVGLMFNGTVAPLCFASLLCSGLAWILLRSARRLDPAPKTTPHS